MKSERRHELQHNDLAEWINSAYERIVPYRRALIAAGVLGIVLILVLIFWHSHSAGQVADSWEQLGAPMFQPDFFNTQTVAQMQHAAQTYPSFPAGQWALVFSGDTSLMIGTNKILTDKAMGVDYLTKARQIYSAALESLTIPGAQERAKLGKARSIEALIENQSQVDEAIAAYEDLNKSFPKGMYQAIADQRIEQLKKPNTLKFYETFAQYKPKPPTHSQSGTPGSVLENPPEEMPVPTAPVSRNSGQPGPGLPEPSSTPLGPMTSAPPKSSGQTLELPAAEPPKGSAVKLQPLQPDIPKAEAPKTEAPKSTAVKAEAPKAETPKK